MIRKPESADAASCAGRDGRDRFGATGGWADHEKNLEFLHGALHGDDLPDEQTSRLRAFVVNHANGVANEALDHRPGLSIRDFFSPRRTEATKAGATFCHITMVNPGSHRQPVLPGSRRHDPLVARTQYNAAVTNEDITLIRKPESADAASCAGRDGRDGFGATGGRADHEKNHEFLHGDGPPDEQTSRLRAFVVNHANGRANETLDHRPVLSIRVIFSPRRTEATKADATSFHLAIANPG